MIDQLFQSASYARHRPPPRERRPTTRRAFLAGLGLAVAAPALLRVAPAAAQSSQIDWCFACTGGKAQFAADLRQFCQDAGWIVQKKDAAGNLATVLDPDGKPAAMLVDQGADLSLSFPNARPFDDLRIDIDLIEDLEGVPPVIAADGKTIVTPAVMRGWHCNVRSSPVSAKAAAVAAQVDGALRAWFAAKSLVLHDTPASMLTAYGVTAASYRTTTGGTKFIDPLPVAFRKRVWAWDAGRGIWIASDRSPRVRHPAFA